MDKLRLREMELSDLLDVLHFYYEKDSISSSEQEIRVKDAVRKSVYSLLYNKEYMYSTTFDDEGSYDEDNYAPPPEGTVKPYIPPTSPEELQAMLGPAMGE